MTIGYDDKLKPNISHTKFLGMNIASTLSWRTHIEKLISKLSTACYVIKSIKPYMSHTTMIMVYYYLFLSIMNYGLIFWGNASYSCKTFRIQKKVIRIIMKCRSRDSCSNLFKKLRILPLVTAHIFFTLICS